MILKVLGSKCNFVEFYGQNVILEVLGCSRNLCEVWIGWVLVLGFGLSVKLWDLI